MRLFEKGKRIMPLKLKLKSKDEIPAEVQSLYVERDGAWVLDVEGAADAVQLRAKLDEFRTNNFALAKERDELSCCPLGFTV